MRITREAPWAQLHTEVMGPSNSYLYFGPTRSPGYLVYGNSPHQSMSSARRQKRENSTYVQDSALIGSACLTTPNLPLSSRYFVAQNGKEYKWKIATQGLEVRPIGALLPTVAPSNSETLPQCIDSKGSTVAIWETSQLQDEFHARLTVRLSALAIITEIVTTLTLNRIASILNW